MNSAQLHTWYVETNIMHLQLVNFKFASMFICDIIFVILLCIPTPQDKVNHVFVLLFATQKHLPFGK